MKETVKKLKIPRTKRFTRNLLLSAYFLGWCGWVLAASSTRDLIGHSPHYTLACAPTVCSTS